MTSAEVWSWRRLPVHHALMVSSRGVAEPWRGGGGSRTGYTFPGCLYEDNFFFFICRELEVRYELCAVASGSIPVAVKDVV